MLIFFSVWLCWVLIALHEPSLVVTSAGYSCSAWASHWEGFYCCCAKTSGVVAHGLNSCGAGLSCSAACGIFPDQGLNQSLLHWQANSYPLHDQGSPGSLFSLAISSVIKVLHSTYYTFLLTLTSRNWDRRGNKGKRIKPHFNWAGSLPCPLPTFPSSLSQSNPIPKGCPGVVGVGTVEQERKSVMYTGGVKWLNEEFHHPTQKWS